MSCSRARQRRPLAKANEALVKLEKGRLVGRAALPPHLIFLRRLPGLRRLSEGEGPM